MKPTTDRKTHELKCIQPYFEEVFNERKPFEIRKNDRDYRVGDRVIQKEFDPSNNSYSGREKDCGVITYILTDYEAIKEEYVVFGLSFVPSQEAKQAKPGVEILPTDAETEKWFEENIGNPHSPCSASSAIYKFRLWLKERSSTESPDSDKKAVEFVEWIRLRFQNTPLEFDNYWEDFEGFPNNTGKTYTTAELLTLFKNRTQ